MAKKIIIVGAGISGLAACTYLMKYGFDVTILEARERMGGRVWTNNIFGIPFGCGASWIHGVDGNPMTQLANDSHTKIVSVNPEQFITYDHSGHLISQHEIDKFNIKFDGLLKRAKEFAYKSNCDISLFSALQEVIKFVHLSSFEVALYEAKLIFLEGYLGAGSELLSARHWDDEEVWPGKNCFLIDTYQPIIDELMKNCSIKLNSIVKKINEREHGIEVETEETIFYGDAVIVTVPLGVLKKDSIIFDPPLPEDKQKAIKNLGMGIFNITAIQFPTVFWPDSHAMFFTQFDALSIPVFFNFHHFTGRPIIAGYSGGVRAQRLEDFSDKELIKKTMNNFKEIFGPQLPEPESYLITRWASDRFSYGSYAYIPIGASANDYEIIAQPVRKRLFFAGEATCSQYPATTYGAYLSGIREADRIRKIFHS